MFAPTRHGVSRIDARHASGGSGCPGWGGAGSVATEAGVGWRGWEGRPAVWVWFLVFGRAGAPMWVRPRGPGCLVWLPLTWCKRWVWQVAHSWVVHSMISRSAGLAVRGVSPLAHRPIWAWRKWLLGRAAGYAVSVACPA